MSTNAYDVLSRLSRSVPVAVADRASAWVAGTEPVPARPSASVILIRALATPFDKLRERSGNGIEVYLMRRDPQMKFAPEMVVFPGGGLDPEDDSDLVRCAIREVQEETGLLLVPDLLRPWAHWITPEVEPRRYDTHFFLAVVPADADLHDISGEADWAGWVTPATALEGAERGEVGLMPPTRSILLELADLADPDEALAAAAGRQIGPVLPRLVRAPGSEWRFQYPPFPVAR